MQKIIVTVGPDGRVTIPNTRPGQTIMLQFATVAGLEEPNRLTLATARTDEEKAAVVAEIKRLAHQLQEEIGPGQKQLSIAHGDLLYDENGLPN